MGDILDHSKSAKKAKDWEDFWDWAKEETRARINIPFKGWGLPTRTLLELQEDLAMAKDAIDERGHGVEAWASLFREHYPPDHVLSLSSKIRNVEEYLLYPHLGRQLNALSLERMKSLPSTKASIVLVVTDGLSFQAIQEEASTLIHEFLLLCRGRGLSVHPFLFLVSFGRVAVIDHIGDLLTPRPEVGILLVGERPGLRSHASLGAYVTYQPRLGLTDAQRNCVSNISRGQGVHPHMAARTLLGLVEQILLKKISGTEIKWDHSSMLSDS